MNNDNRAELQRAIDLIEEAKGIIEQIKDGEQDKFDNLSEGLQQTERGQKFEQDVDTLSSVVDELDNQISEINGVME